MFLVARTQAGLVLLFVLTLLGQSFGAEKYRLHMSRAPLKGGQQLRFHVQFQVEDNRQMGSLATNRAFWGEVSGITRILEWDEPRQTGQIEIYFERAFKGTSLGTNSLVTGKRLVRAKWLLGEVFFTASDAMAAAETRELPDALKTLAIPPRDWFWRDDATAGTALPREIGETWRTAVSNHPLGARAKRSFERSGFHLKDHPCEIILAGVTNMFGFPCFRLVAKFAIDSFPEKLFEMLSGKGYDNPRCVGTHTTTLIAPLDPSYNFLHVEVVAVLRESLDSATDPKKSAKWSNETRAMLDYQPIAGTP